MTDFSVIERSIDIEASVADLLALVDDFHAWQQWSPWEGLDPDLHRTYSGPTSGVGATYEWSGNRKAGAGQMRIERVDDANVDIDLQFRKPFKSSSTSHFAFAAATAGPAGATTVTWTLRSPKTFGMKVAGLFMNFERAIGGDLEKGLAQLKTVAETAPA